MHGNMNVN